MEDGTDFQAMLQRISPDPEPQQQMQQQLAPQQPTMPEMPPQQSPVSSVNGLAMPFASPGMPGIGGITGMNWETEDIILLVLAGSILFLCLMYCKGNNKTVLL